MLDRFADYWDKDRIHIDRITYLPIPDSTVRLANLRAGALDLIERMLADRHPDGAKATRGSSCCCRRRRSPTRGSPSISPTPTGRRTRSARTPRCARRSSSRSTATPSTRSCSTATSRRAINGRRRPTSITSQKFPIPKRNVAKAKALIKEAGVTTPITLELMVPNQPDVKQVAEVLQAMAAEAGFDLKIRLTEFATSLDEGREGQLPDLPDRLERARRSRPERHQSSRLQHAVQLGQVLQRDDAGRPERGAHGERAGQAQGGLREGARRRSRPTSR